LNTRGGSAASPLQLSRPADRKKTKYSTEKIVHKILIETRYGDVAVEWAVMFKLVMNLKSTKRINLTIPQQV
jgi:ABC-type uncharacterized transport system substrate-binding protein